jgi:predicted NUDIX family NTP pyrophosphohydrolase
LPEHRRTSSKKRGSRRPPGTSSAASGETLRGPSAGILLYRGEAGRHEVLLVHPGGPWWRRQEAGAWSIPKGECMADEQPYCAARREFVEELGAAAPDGQPLALGEIRQKAGKRVLAWALAGDLDASAIKSNTFTLEWPPHSGQFRDFPEVDRAQWFPVEAARQRINPAQVELLDRLEAALA